MPATKADLEELRGILRYLRGPTKPGDSVISKLATDALERALSYLDDTVETNSPLWWAAGALKGSMRKIREDYYVVTNRGTHSWALRQIWELLPNVEEGGLT